MNTFFKVCNYKGVEETGWLKIKAKPTQTWLSDLWQRNKYNSMEEGLDSSTNVARILGHLYTKDEPDTILTSFT